MPKQLKKEFSELVFRDVQSKQIIKITKHNCTDALVALAENNGKGHCFENYIEPKKKPLSSPSTPVISTLTEVPIDEPTLNEVLIQPATASPQEKKKRGPKRKPKG